MTLLYNDEKKPLFLSAPCLQGKSNSAVTWEHVTAYGSTASAQSPTQSNDVREEVTVFHSDCVGWRKLWLMQITDQCARDMVDFSNQSHCVRKDSVGG